MRPRALVLALALGSGTNALRARAEPPASVLAARMLPPGPLAMVLAPAVALATERLGTDGCRQVFEELCDFTGRPVARRLEAGERSASSHFARLLFRETREGPCLQGLVAAWSAWGDVHVRICSQEFRSIAGRDRREAAAILIHEALHTLGVAEDAAKEPLTAYVRRRCGL